MKIKFLIFTIALKLFIVDNAMALSNNPWVTSTEKITVSSESNNVVVSTQSTSSTDSVVDNVDDNVADSIVSNVTKQIDNEIEQRKQSFVDATFNWGAKLFEPVVQFFTNLVAIVTNFFKTAFDIVANFCKSAYIYIMNLLSSCGRKLGKLF